MWTGEIASIVFTKVKVGAEKELKTKYPDISFTTSDRVQRDPKFPSVYIKELGSPESGSDLEGNFVYSINSTFQIEVSDSISQERAKRVMDKIVYLMKKMKYKISVSPYPNNTEGVYRVIARFTRNVDWNDIL